MLGVPCRQFYSLSNKACSPVVRNRTKYNSAPLTKRKHVADREVRLVNKKNVDTPFLKRADVR